MIYFRNQVTRFVVIFPGRTGSTFLVQALDSHPEVSAFGEGLSGLAKEGAQAQFDWMYRMLTPPTVGRRKALGFKTKLQYIQDREGFSEILKGMNAQVILLQRKNRVKLVVSWINSERLYQSTGKYNLYNEQERLPPPSIDLAEFEKKLAHVEAEKKELETFVNQLGLATLHLEYEDLFQKSEEAFQKVFDFIRVSYQPVQAQTIKNTSDDLREAVMNYDELYARYMGTPYEPMFEHKVEQPAQGI